MNECRPHAPPGIYNEAEEKTTVLSAMRTPLTQLVPVPGKDTKSFPKVGSLGPALMEWVELRPVGNGVRGSPGQPGSKHKTLYADYTRNINRINAVCRDHARRMCID